MNGNQPPRKTRESVFFFLRFFIQSTCLYYAVVNGIVSVWQVKMSHIILLSQLTFCHFDCVSRKSVESHAIDAANNWLSNNFINKIKLCLLNYDKRDQIFQYFLIFWSRFEWFIAYFDGHSWRLHLVSNTKSAVCLISVRNLAILVSK